MDDPFVLKIFLIGFHHKKGCQKDNEYPIESKYDFDIEKLPSLCLPDQSHNFEQDSVYFILPNSEDKRIFGVSCFRQIQTEKLINRKECDGTDFFRSTVQKSVCCLSTVPLFGYIEVKLNLYVDKIFEQADFNKCEELLKECYHELNRCISLRLETIDINDFYIGLCLRELIDIWKQKVLVLFKLLLLEKRVLFYGSPVKPLCTTILSIISLHPLLSLSLCNTHEIRQKLSNSSNLIEKSPSKSASDDDDIQSEANEAQEQINLEVLDHQEYHAPMVVFKNGYLCLPFISLQYIETITDKLNNGFVVGASNVLFQQKRNLVDILIDVPSQTIEYIDMDLKKCMHLTTEDLRFFEHVSKGIDSPSEETGIGTDQWIRKQFESYFISLLRTNYDNEAGRELECFNELFMEEWRKTNNFQDWLARKITLSSDGNEFDKFLKGHPFSKQSINVSDVKNKIAQSINNTPSARKTVTALSTTFSNAKSSLSSWLANLSVKEEAMEAKECDKIDNET